MAVSQALTITQVSQSIVNNYSVVRILWQSTQTGESWNGGTRTAYYYVSKNGGAEEKYSISYTLPKRSTKTIVDVEIIVPHNDDGTGSVNVRTWMDTKISAGVVEMTRTLALPTIPRKSTLSVPDGILDRPLKLTVTRQADLFTHTIEYTCGSTQGVIAEKSSSTSISWTPPSELAFQAPSASKVVATFTITTYNGDNIVGKATTTANLTIPNTTTYSPVLAISTSDAKGYASKYGGYVQGHSQLSVNVITYGTYGAWIKECKTIFNGQTFTELNIENVAIYGSGVMPVTTTVTDSRERKISVASDLNVLPYLLPKINMVATRSDATGKSDPSGAYIAVIFSSDVPKLNNKNSAVYSACYKKLGDSDYTPVDSDNFNGQYVVTDGMIVVPADVSSGYEFILSVYDDFNTTTKTVIVGSAKKVWSMLKQDGAIVSAALGKVAEPSLLDVFDIAFQTRFSGGLLHSVLPTNSDLDSLKVPNTYMLLTANEYYNVPETGIAAFLEIVGIKDTSIVQRYSVFSTANPREYERTFFADRWSQWVCTRGDFVVEQGEKDGWTYRKWNSGDAECWKIVTHTTKVNTSWGSLYVGNTPVPRQNYPFPFTSKPVENVSVLAGSNMGMIYPEQSGYGVNGGYASAMYNVCSPSAVSTDVTYYYSYNIKGKWK